MELHLGFPELFGAIVVLIGSGWALLNLTFMQFEKRLDIKFASQDEKFKTQSDKFDVQSERIKNLEVVTLDVKRLELEIVKRDSLYVPRSELQATFDKMFMLLREIQQGLDRKVSRDDCDKMRDEKRHS